MARLALDATGRTCCIGRHLTGSYRKGDGMKTHTDTYVASSIGAYRPSGRQGTNRNGIEAEHHPRVSRIRGHQSSSPSLDGVGDASLCCP